MAAKNKPKKDKSRDWQSMGKMLTAIRKDFPDDFGALTLRDSIASDPSKPHPDFVPEFRIRFDDLFRIEQEPGDPDSCQADYERRLREIEASRLDETLKELNRNAALKMLELCIRGIKLRTRRLGR